MPHAPTFQISHLTKCYGPLVAVDDLSLEIRAGEILGFLGPNGAGKSTAIRMMCGLLAADGGQVLLDGEPVRTGAAVRRRIGVCPQQIVIWARLTCLEQLTFVGEMYGLSGRLARVKGAALLERMGLADKRHALAGTLSGGMQRRLSLVLALVHEPDVLILDEPEAGLDPQSRVLVREFVRSLAGTMTIVLTSHNMDEVDRLAARVAIIDHGRLLRVGSPHDLKQHLGGDALELELAPEHDGEAVREALAALVPDLQRQEGGYLLRAPDLAARVGAVLQALERVHCPVRNLRLRESTLEDVFIALTGRGLRE